MEACWKTHRRTGGAMALSSLADHHLSTGLGCAAPPLESSQPSTSAWAFWIQSIFPPLRTLKTHRTWSWQLTLHTSLNFSVKSHNHQTTLGRISHSPSTASPGPGPQILLCRRSSLLALLLPRFGTVMAAATLMAQAKARRAAAAAGMAPGTQKIQRDRGQLEAAPQHCGTGRPGLSDWGLSG